ncbi:MAG: HAD hydrolase-like protein [Planctomycetota bacterium]
MLILFDIDHTLLASPRSGPDGLTAAGRELYGDTFKIEAVDFAGRIDPLILGDALESNGQPRSDLPRYREAFIRHFEPLARDRTHALDGAAQLIEAVKVEGVTSGLLTGNFEETGRMKLAAAGFDADAFPVRVWGDSSPHDPPAREHLPPVAMQLHAKISGRTIPSEDVVVIGDTPHDVSCALANGCRVLAVATGRTSAADLAACGAHEVVEDLTETERILEWLMRPSAT